MSQPTPRKVHSLKEAGEVLGCSVDFLRKQNRAGLLAFKKMGKKFVVTDAELDRYVDDLEGVVPRR